MPSSLTMEIRGCPILTMFPCQYLNTVELKTADAPLQPFRNKKVEFPIIKKLVLNDGSMLEGVLHAQLPSGSFSKVRFLEVKNYYNLVNARTLLQWFEVVEELKVEYCFSLEVVFKLEELDAIQRKSIVSSQIKKLTLICLPKLVNIWIMEPQGLLVFHNLTYLTVQACYSLRYLLSLSMASLLTQLRVLVIQKCSVMEEIVGSEGQGEEDAKGEIVFSHTLDIKVTGDGGLLRHVSDLNSYVQQYIRKGKGLAVDDDDDEETGSGDDDETSSDEEI
ncbi:uncharacterized protein LOC132305111 [Cornus florida]|uniref:uncharacterized protein LOC132305111 n=1 Tax=Cornus florida TaxID=4283 RepID=UPI00289A8216|nr:uncharacterized protein LOC132305111 [Cornus florida]